MSAVTFLKLALPVAGISAVWASLGSKDALSAASPLVGIVFLAISLNLLVFSGTFRRFALKPLTPSPIPGIPHLPHQAPLLGDVFALGARMKELKTPSFTKGFESFIVDMIKGTGKGICQMIVSTGASGKFVFVTDVKEAEDILVRRHAEFDRADVTISVLSGLVPNGQIALPTDAHWKHNRRLMGPSMTSKNLAAFTPRVMRTADQFVELWRVKSQVLGPGQLFDCRDDFFFGLTDVIAEIAFGESLGCLDEALARAREGNHRVKEQSKEVLFPVENPPSVFIALTFLLKELPQLSPVPRISNWINTFKPAHRKHKKILNTFLARKISEGNARAAERAFEDGTELADCVLDLACRKQDTDDRLDDTNLSDELLQFLVAGEETTSTSLAWLMKRLANSPEVQRRLRDELIQAGLDQRMISYADLSSEKLPYLEAVCQEGLRLSTTASGVVREAKREVEILGHVIPKGTTVFVPLGLLQTTPPRYLAAQKNIDSLERIDDYDEFKPERWLTEDGRFSADKVAGSWPFSLGQRGCFGKALGILDFKAFLIKINLNFFLESVPAEYDSFEYIEVVTRQAIQPYVRPVPWS